MKKQHKALALTAITSTALAATAGAAGFALQERSTSGLGRAFSGEAAIGDDASAMASNPAILHLLGDNALSSGFSYIVPDVKVKGTANPGAVPASDSGPAQAAVVPYLYASQKLNDQWALGLAVHSRFGLSTEYGQNFPSASLARKSEITTIYISPKVSYQLTNDLSIGAGFDAIYADGELSSTVPGSNTHILDLAGDDWAYGYNLGVLYRLNEKTRIGLSYHSSIDVDLEGSVDTDTGVPSLLLPPGGSVDGNVEVELPDTIELSVHHQVNERFAVHGDVLWTKWSSFDNLTIETDNGGSNNTPENWKDTFRLAVGATYKHDDKWTFRAGFAYDESPVKTSEFRTLRIPDADRYWLSVGATYQINDCYSVDFGYAHIFAKTVDITEAVPGAGTFDGEASGSVDIIGLSINGTF